MNVIETAGLCKSYGDLEVLHNVNIVVQPGRLVGFLGPNGAGKTTTIRILLGLINATHGSSQVLGFDAWRQGPRLRRDVGYLPGEVRLYRNLNGFRLLQFLARARGVDCHSEIQRLGSVFELDLSKRVGDYSSGMKQKLGLIQAIMHRPQLLILDEPTTGLDPLVRKSVFAELRGFVDENRSVLFSSHSLTEIEQLCDDVIILRNGRVIEHERIEQLQSRALRKITLVFDSTDQIPDQLPTRLKLTRRHQLSIEGNWTGGIDELVAWLGNQPIADVIIERPNLEDLFLTYYASTDSAAPDPQVEQGA